MSKDRSNEVRTTAVTPARTPPGPPRSGATPLPATPARNAEFDRRVREMWAKICAEPPPLDSDLPPPGHDPRPAAAFSLGYEPRRFRAYQWRLCRRPCDHTAGSQLLLAVDLFREALFDLAAHVGDFVGCSLRDVLRVAPAIAEDLVGRAYRASQDYYDDRVRRTQEALGEPIPETACPALTLEHGSWWGGWRKLADCAIKPDRDDLVRLGRYGAALGDLAVRLEECDGQGADGREADGHLRAVVRAVHDVPNEYASRAKLTSALRSVGPDEAADQLVRGLEAERSADRDTLGVLCGMVQGLLREQEDFFDSRRGAGRPADEDARSLPAGTWREVPHLGVRFDEGNRRVARLDGKPVNFGARVIPWLIMRHFLQQQDDFCRSEALMNAAWGTERGCEQRLYTTISNLKADLDQLGLYAESVRKAGYRLRRLPRGE